MGLKQPAYQLQESKIAIEKVQLPEQSNKAYIRRAINTRPW